MGSRIPFYFFNSDLLTQIRRKLLVYQLRGKNINYDELVLLLVTKHQQWSCQFWHIVLFWIFLFSPIRWYIYFILTNYAHPADRSCFWTKNQSFGHRILQVKMATVTAWLSQENGRQPRTQGLHPSFVKQVVIVWSLRSLLGPKFYNFT